MARRCSLDETRHCGYDGNHAIVRREAGCVLRTSKSFAEVPFQSMRTESSVQMAWCHAVYCRCAPHGHCMDLFCLCSGKQPYTHLGIFDNPRYRLRVAQTKRLTRLPQGTAACIFTFYVTQSRSFMDINECPIFVMCRIMWSPSNSMT